MYNQDKFAETIAILDSVLYFIPLSLNSLIAKKEKCGYNRKDKKESW
jgi:hypothetical protein